ncbi:MAG: hypothetical protein KKA81_17585 [Bacteroidetes bacterium]|nr:hypothetical protein [Bacteroidota bacterium]
MKDITRVKLELSAELHMHGDPQRRGLFATHHERYFFAAFLIPYTAHLKAARGNQASPDWNLIEAWLRKSAGIPEEKNLRLRSWWNKEIVRRKSSTSRPLLYALAAGAALFLETRKAGKRPIWTVARDHMGRPVTRESHPLTLKRSLTKEDLSYLRCVFMHVPLIREDFMKHYPRTRELAAKLPKNPLEAIVNKRKEKFINKLPMRGRLSIARRRDEVLSLEYIEKHLQAEAKGKLLRKELRHLARLYREGLRKSRRAGSSKLRR